MLMLRLKTRVTGRPFSLPHHFGMSAKTPFKMADKPENFGKTFTKITSPTRQSHQDSPTRATTQSWAMSSPDLSHTAWATPFLKGSTKKKVKEKEKSEEKKVVLHPRTQPPADSAARLIYLRVYDSRASSCKSASSPLSRVWPDLVSPVWPLGPILGLLLFLPTQPSVCEEFRSLLFRV
jgi:hypothetical protein